MVKLYNMLAEKGEERLIKFMIFHYGKKEEVDISCHELIVERTTYFQMRKDLQTMLLVFAVEASLVTIAPETISSSRNGPDH